MLCRAGLGLEIEYDAAPVRELHKLREGTNVELIKGLKESEHSETLFRSCVEDQQNGRMDSARF